MLFVSSIICVNSRHKCKILSQKIELLGNRLHMLISFHESSNYVVSPFGVAESLYNYEKNITYILYYKEFYTTFKETSPMEYYNKLLLFLIGNSNSASILDESEESTHKNNKEVQTITRRLYLNQDKWFGIKFNIRWKDEFSEFSTTDKYFYTDVKNYTVSMMSAENYYMCGNLLNISASFIELPLKDNFYMLVVLPDVGINLEAVETNMAHHFVSDLTMVKQTMHVDLELPQFSIKFNDKFSSILTSDDRSNSTDAVNYLIQHIANIEVNESGLTTATTNNEISFFPVSVGNGYKFHVNRPFHFKVIKRTCGDSGNLVIFSGSVKKFE
ncbi:intracellular coagulation inhibitor 2-like isoform X2 [Leptopilina heterotoma]|nr:intracellular coagulation inhibitor 2-like isoform X2 [Leptopilina heterotoma]